MSNLERYNTVLNQIKEWEKDQSGPNPTILLHRFSREDFNEFNPGKYKDMEREYQFYGAILYKKYSIYYIKLNQHIFEIEVDYDVQGRMSYEDVPSIMSNFDKLTFCNPESPNIKVLVFNNNSTTVKLQSFKVDINDVNELHPSFYYDCIYTGFDLIDIEIGKPVLTFGTMYSNQFERRKYYFSDFFIESYDVKSDVGREVADLGILFQSDTK